MSDDLHNPSANSEDSEETYVIPDSAGDEIDRIFERFMHNQSPFGFQPREQTLTYHPLPYEPGPDDRLLLAHPWRIVLELQVADRPLRLGLDLYGDIILGRGKSRPGRLVLDLADYSAKEQGVSREHAMLRPTSNRLFLIDQGSTNRTVVNGVPSGRGVATPLSDEAMISLGNLLMMLHIVSRPGD